MFHISFLSLFPQAECQRNEDCAQDMACEDYNCINPCQTIGCEKDYFCKVIKHVATCGRKFVPVPQEVSVCLAVRTTVGLRYIFSSNHITKFIQVFVFGVQTL